MYSWDGRSEYMQDFAYTHTCIQFTMPSIDAYICTYIHAYNAHTLHAFFSGPFRTSIADTQFTVYSLGASNFRQSFSHMLKHHSHTCTHININTSTHLHS